VVTSTRGVVISLGESLLSVLDRVLAGPTPVRADRFGALHRAGTHSPWPGRHEGPLMEGGPG
jgi:hypothetical protein